MARTTAPLFSMDASGTIAGSIVFSRWRGRNYVRRHAVPSNPRSDLQVGIRSAFRFVTQQWKNLPSPIQAAWVTVGDVTRVTGLNAMIADNIRRLREGRVWVYDPIPVTPLQPLCVTALSCTALSKALQLDWTPAAPSGADWGLEIHMSLTGAFAPSIATLVYCVPWSNTQLILTGLVPGTPYYFDIRAFGNALGYSIVDSQCNGTPNA